MPETNGGNGRPPRPPPPPPPPPGGGVGKLRGAPRQLAGEPSTFVIAVAIANVAREVPPVRCPLHKFTVAPRQGNTGVVYFSRTYENVTGAHRMSFPVDSAPLTINAEDAGGWMTGPNAGDALEFTVEIPGPRA